MTEFECVHCGGVNEIDLGEVNLSELIDQSIDPEIESEKIQSLKEKLKKKEILLDRSNEELKKVQSGVKSAMSKTETPSVEIQGEIAEEVLFDDLESAFSDDDFHRIKKGKSGADIHQIVISSSGHQAGSILYESKNTRNWSNDWVPKLRANMQESGATVALLVSKAFPAKEKDVLAQLEDRIWLCKPGIHLPAFVRAIREGIIMGHRRDVLDEYSSKTDKQVLYEYITGDFVEQIKNIVRVYNELSEEIIKEQKAFKTKWSKRQKVLDQLADSMTGIAGSIQGIGVKSLKLEKMKELTLE